MRSLSPRTARLGALALILALSACKRVSEAPTPHHPVEVAVVDESGAPLPARMHLKNEKGERVLPKGVLGYHDHFVFDGKARFDLADGTYRYEVERGPEYRPVQGNLRVGATTAPVRVRLVRIDDLAKDGWFSGDLHVHRPKRDIELLMRAEDLHVATSVVWGNSRVEKGDPPVAFDGNRVFDASAGEDERFGGALLFLRLGVPFSLPQNLRVKGKIAHKEGVESEELPPSTELARQAKRDPRAHVSIEKPFWWDVPAWLASGTAGSVGIVHNHMSRTGPRNHEAWGRKCDRTEYGKSAFANGYCTQDIYYRILDLGLRLPPSAGSGSGVLPNPLGFDRVYVHVDSEFSYEKWWQAFEAGQSFVTNGPLLRVLARTAGGGEATGELPGHVFRGERRVEIALDVRARSVEPISSVELVRDGRVVEKAKYDAKTNVAAFSPLAFEKSGWFLVRVIGDRKDAFRFASSAPYYVEIPPDTRRVSRAAVAFFQNWVKERISNLEKKARDPKLVAPAIAEQHKAERYYAELFARANAD